MTATHSENAAMSGVIGWLRDLARRGGKGVVNNIDARTCGRIADDLERLSFELDQARAVIAKDESRND